MTSQPISDHNHPKTHTSVAYTLDMTSATTTIRVDKQIRDRLAALAEAHGRSLGEELGAMLDDLAWQDIEAGYRRLAADEVAVGRDRADAERWLSLDLESLATGAQVEYPEYNGVEIAG